MKAVTLNENQKSKTLSAKKQKSKKTVTKIRPVLATHTKFQAFELKKAHCDEFKEKMLHYYKFTPVPKIKWSVLQKLSKDERKEMKNKEKNVVPSRNCIALGFNEVTRSLESSTATVVVISNNITPEILLKHIYQLCNLHKIPLLKVNNFKDISKECFGFSSMMMSFREISQEEKIFDFYNYIQSCLIDQNILESADKEPIEKLMPMETEHVIESRKVDNKTSKVSNLRDVHLFRNDKTKRAFIPQPKNEKPDAFNADFIGFDHDYKIEDEKGQTILFPGKAPKKNMLKALRIKKLIGNPNRKKAKENK